MSKFLKKYWYYIVMLLMLVALYILYKKATAPQPVVTDTTIEDLRARVDSLYHANDSLQIAYDVKQATIINNITYKNIQDAKNISKIPNLTNHQRDSLWAKFFTTEDSVPGGYWNILKQKTGGRNPKELSVQGIVQK
jgi:hypothetical protein